MSQKLTGRDEVKALPLQAIFEDALRGEDTAFVHSDEDTFTFAKQRARTATQRLLDAAGVRFSGRISVITDPAKLTITYAAKGQGTARAPVAARKRVEKREATKPSGRTVQTRDLEPRGETGGRYADPSICDGEMIYWCHCAFTTVGPAYEVGDDIRCGHCSATRLAALADQEISEGEEPTPTIYPIAVIENGLAVKVGRAAAGRPARRRSRKDVREGDLGEHISEAAIKARKARRKQGRDSLARRRGR